MEEKLSLNAIELKMLIDMAYEISVPVKQSDIIKSLIKKMQKMIEEL